jgi:hypothetical protein
MLQKITMHSGRGGGGGEELEEDETAYQNKKELRVEIFSTLTLNHITGQNKGGADT